MDYNTHEPLVHVSFVQPDFYAGIPDQFRVGYTPWESSEIPERWVFMMNQMDDLWTTANYCKDIYKSYGIEDVKVVPHGIDPEVWKINYRYKTDVFYFFHVGSPTARKGGQKVVDVFLDEFKDDDDVHLVMKSNGPTDARYYDERGIFKSAAQHEKIHVYEGYLEVWDLAHLYNQVHCLVYPTNGEGFGFIPFQGIASGLPTICTDASGCADFAKLSIPLKATPAVGKGIHIGDWFDPDIDDLRAQMRWVYNNYDQAVEKTTNSAKIIHATQTWDHIADQIIEILGDKIYQKV